MYLKSLEVTNYCGYENHKFSFVKNNGEPYKFVCFYGPNGIGKSTLLESISLLTSNQINRNPTSIKSALRKYVFNTDYDPTYDKLKDYTIKNQIAHEHTSSINSMLIEGVFVLDGKEYVVTLNENGFVRNDLAPLDDSRNGPWGEDHLKYRQRIIHVLTADNELIRSKFQLHYGQVEKFLPLIKEIVRYPVECTKPQGMTSQDRGYCMDVIMQKTKKRNPNRPIKVHFKSMSDGEQKILKSFSQLLNLMYDLENPMPGDDALVGWPKIVLIDNIEMHVYYDRHISFVDCLKKQFNEQQIFATSHSGILIPRAIAGQNDKENELWIDLEPVNS